MSDNATGHFVNTYWNSLARGEPEANYNSGNHISNPLKSIGIYRHWESYMKPFRGIALAMAGVSIAIFGLSISIIGQTIAQVGSTNFGPGVFLGALVAAIGAVISLISALVLEESR